MGEMAEDSIMEESAQGATVVEAERAECANSSTQLCVCTKCEQPIKELYVLKVIDSPFHAGCLRCGECDSPLSSSCFLRHNEIFCKHHYYKRYGTKCAQCGEGISPDSTVRRAQGHIYHIECFCCSLCHREMHTGEQFYLIPEDGAIVCKGDYEAAKEKANEMDASNKRPRTTISAKSLETLKQAYQTSSKPARHVREQLAAETGLDMRVVQVWFQNRRAKEKRLKKDAGRRWPSDSSVMGGQVGTPYKDSDSGSPGESCAGASPPAYGGVPQVYVDTSMDLGAVGNGGEQGTAGNSASDTSSSFADLDTYSVVSNGGPPPPSMPPLEHLQSGGLPPLGPIEIMGGLIDHHHLPHPMHLSLLHPHLGPPMMEAPPMHDPVYLPLATSSILSGLHYMS